MDTRRWELGGGPWFGRNRKQAQTNAVIYYDTEFLEVTRWKGTIWPPFLGSRLKAGGVAILSGRLGRGETQ